MANYEANDWQSKPVNNSLPKHLILNNRNIFYQKTIANSFNEYFFNAGPKLACKIPQSEKLFEMYLKRPDSSFEEVTLSDEEINTAFFSLKGGKSPSFDEINCDIVKPNFNSLLVPLKYIFDLSLKSGTFPEKMKIARVTLVSRSFEHFINDKLPTYICTSMLFKNARKDNVP